MATTLESALFCVPTSTALRNAMNAAENLGLLITFEAAGVGNDTWSDDGNTIFGTFPLELRGRSFWGCPDGLWVRVTPGVGSFVRFTLSVPR